jgi:hypothetical protein
VLVVRDRASAGPAGTRRRPGVRRHPLVLQGRRVVHGTLDGSPPDASRAHADGTRRHRRGRDARFPARVPCRPCPATVRPADGQSPCRADPAATVIGPLVPARGVADARIVRSWLRTANAGWPMGGRSCRAGSAPPTPRPSPRCTWRCRPRPSTSVSTASGLRPLGSRGWRASAAAPSASSRPRPPIRAAWLPMPAARASMPRRRSWDWPPGMTIRAEGWGACCWTRWCCGRARRGSGGCEPSSSWTTLRCCACSSVTAGCWPPPRSALPWLSWKSPRSAGCRAGPRRLRDGGSWWNRAAGPTTSGSRRCAQRETWSASAPGRCGAPGELARWLPPGGVGLLRGRRDRQPAPRRRPGLRGRAGSPPGALAAPAHPPPAAGQAGGPGPLIVPQPAAGEGTWIG